MAIDGIAGQKTHSEKFAGADTTYTFEPMMSNGWALQICTSHLLGQGFMQWFGVNFQNREWQLEHPWYTSWGLSTRSIGWIISSHSDDKGLIIPPKMSEYLATILPVYGKDNTERVNTYTRLLAEELAGWNTEVPVQWEYFRAIVWTKWKILIDFRDVRLGEKIWDWEQSGYPIRIECGERDIENNKCVIVSRINGEKLILDRTEAEANITRMSIEWQKKLLENSRKRLEENTIACETLEDVGIAIEAWKFAIYEWDGNPNMEKEIKEKYKATTRCIPFKWQFTDNLLVLKNPKNTKVIIARNF